MARARTGTRTHVANLFGLDIAKIINDSITAAGGVLGGILTHYSPGTRTVGDLAAGLNPTSTVHLFRGFFELKEVRRKGQINTQVAPVVTLLGASITPSTVPAVNDVVTIDGRTLRLVELLRADPASAVFEFMADS